MKVRPVGADRMRALLCGMPKAELHMHIEGSLEPELIFQLARRNGMTLAYPDVESLRQAYVFNNLQDFLDIYHTGTTVLRTEQDFYDMTHAYLARAHADNVVHTEIFFDTQTHTGHGLDAQVVVNGLHRACVDAQAEFGISASLIMCFLRHLSEADAFEALEQVLPIRDKIVGIGLASSEVGHPPEKFAKVFARCRALGFRLVAHAGEEGPPAYIESALDALQVERIDHGVRCTESPALLQRLAASRTPLTVCPLSNVKLRVFDTLAQHNLPALLAAGLCVTVNSDDPAYFGGYLNQNLVETFAALPQLGAAEAYALARNGFEASFVSAAQKAAWVAQLDAFFTEFALEGAR